MDSDAMNVAASYTSFKQNEVQMAVQTKMLRASMDNQEQTTVDLLNTLPKEAAVNPPHLGQNIDMKF